MTDFYSVLQRAIASLPDGSGPQRRAVYDKARKALLKQLQSFDPPLPSSDVTAQRLALEDAIRKIENEIARQIRTRRAVQGALPAAGSARPAAQGTAARPAEPAAPARPQLTEAERRAQREQQAEALASAVTQATAAAPVPVPEPAAPDVQPEVEPAPTAEQSVQPEALLPAIAPDPTPALEPLVETDDVPQEQDAWFDAPTQHRPDIPVSDENLSFEESPRGPDTRALDEEYRNEPGFGGGFAPETGAPPADEDDPAAVAQPRGARKDDKRRKKSAERAAKQAERDRQREERKARRAAEKQAKSKPKAEPKPKRKRQAGGRSVLARAILPVLVLALLAGASYAAYTQRVTLLAMLDDLTQPSPPGTTREPVRVTAAEEGVSKNTDRLPSTLEGEETRSVTTTTVLTGQGEEAGGGNGASAFADGNNGAPAADRVVSATPGTDTTTPPAPAPSEAAPAGTPETNSAAPIGEFSSNNSQQAVLYEEATQAGEQGSASGGRVEWSMVRQSIAGGAPEPVVRANATIPERDLDAVITIRENRDSALPASHLIEIEVTGADGSEAVQSIPGVIMKETEQARGEALRGAAARVSSGLFWVALSENDADRAMNLRLLGERDWIDIPILYESGRRAILTLRKGNDGFQSVNAAIQAWSPG